MFYFKILWLSNYITTKLVVKNKKGLTHRIFSTKFRVKPFHPSNIHNIFPITRYKEKQTFQPIPMSSKIPSRKYLLNFCFFSWFLPPHLSAVSLTFLAQRIWPVIFSTAYQFSAIIYRTRVLNLCLYYSRTFVRNQELF